MDSYTEIYDETRKRIFSLLKRSELNQKEFARVLGVSAQTVTDWKKGKSNSFMQNLDQISRVLHTTPVWLFNGTGAKVFSDEQREEWMRQDKLKFEQWNEQASDEMQEIYLSALARLFTLKGITKQDFYEISQGRTPSQEKVQFIAEMFEITPEQLFKVAKDKLTSNPNEDCSNRGVVVRIRNLYPQSEEKKPTPVPGNSNPQAPADLTADEVQVALAYRAADERTRQMVDLALEPWKKSVEPDRAM